MKRILIVEDDTLLNICHREPLLGAAMILGDLHRRGGFAEDQFLEIHRFLLFAGVPR